jgi:hypothetical protein
MLWDAFADPYFWAYVIYFLAEVGYVSLDIIAYLNSSFYTDYLWTVWYLLLASAFVVDALLFGYGWMRNSLLDQEKHGKTHIELDTSFWAEVFRCVGRALPSSFLLLSTSSSFFFLLLPSSFLLPPPYPFFLLPSSLYSFFLLFVLFSSYFLLPPSSFLLSFTLSSSPSPSYFF